MLWCDWGRALEIGAETCAPRSRTWSFEDCDIIRTTHIAMDIQHGDRAMVHDIRFENIRVEVDEFNPPPVMQKTRDEKYTADLKAGYVPRLFTIIIRRTSYSKDEQGGTVRNVLFKDIFVTGKPLPSSSFTGQDSERDVQGVTIQNLRFNGRPVLDAEAARLKVGGYVKDVRFVEGGGKR